MTRVLMAALATATALTLTTGTAVAAPADTSTASIPASTGITAAASPSRVFSTTDRLAGQVANALADRAVRDRIASKIASGPVDLLTVESSGLGKAARAANKTVLEAKGLPATSGSLLQMRLANPDARAALGRGEVPLVAAAPTDDELTAITAYDPLGGKALLDPLKAPKRPVLVVEVNGEKALPIGLKVLRDTLAAHGTLTPRTVSTQSGGYWATQVKAVRLTDDMEPWVKGAAEIFSIVGGFGLDGKATATIVNMPYLDHDGVTYYPNQLLVHFSAYKYNLADVVMMEDDGDTNYLALAQAITTALLTIADLGYYAPLVNAILAALPTSWWTDDPDYVDSWYTLATTSRGRLTGASVNGWMDVAPYWVSEL